MYMVLMQTVTAGTWGRRRPQAFLMFGVSAVKTYPIWLICFLAADA